MKYADRIMFDLPETLSNNLNNDGFFDNNNELYIIDDHHVKDITQKSIDFYVDAFRNTGVRIIHIYHQARNYKEDDMNQLNTYCRVNGLNFNKYISFQNMVGISVKKRGQWGEPDEKRMLKNSDKALNFIHSMRDVGINVVFQYYDSLHFVPPFHGRYWITMHNKGYIVDGSLNTINSDRVFAQLMSDDNYNIIKDLFDRYILPNSRPYSPIGINEINEMRDVLSHHYDIPRMF